MPNLLSDRTMLGGPGKALTLLLQDVVGPGTPAQPTTMEVRVFMQQSKDLTAAAAAECKDKFLIQSTPVPPDWVRPLDLLMRGQG